MNSAINTKNNARGRLLEEMISLACDIYKEQGLLHVIKVPEPFRTTSKESGGVFKGRFIANAEPDFFGVLKGGQAICIEAKSTTKDRIEQNAVTPKQFESMSFIHGLGGLAVVIAQISDGFYCIPWGVWENMKERFGVKYAKAEWLSEYKIKVAVKGRSPYLDFISVVARLCSDGVFQLGLPDGARGR